MTAFVDGQPVTLTGAVTGIEPHITEVSRSPWATATLATSSDVLTVRIFPAVWPTARQHVTDGAQITVRGRIDLHTGELRLDAHQVTPAEGACGRCSQTRPLFEFSWVPDGWMEFKEIHLCARCHSLSALEDEDGLLDSTPLLTAIGALR